MEERRQEKRYRCVLWVRFTGEGEGEWAAVSRDVSRSGLLMAVGPRLEVGSAVTLRFRIHPDDVEEQHLEGRVVRLDEGVEDPKGLWAHRAAIEFAAPLPGGGEEALRQLTECVEAPPRDDQEREG